MKRIIYIKFLFLSLGFLVSCEDFLLTDNDLVLIEDDIPRDQVELRATTLGLYALQQELVEQIVILGELRGDLLEVTRSADPDLREINNFHISPNNRYVDPSNFYRLIAASNKVIRILEDRYLSQIDSLVGITDYHRMLGEAICMRSWAYFNAARIYNEIPYIPEELTDMHKIIEYVNSPGTYVDSTFVRFHPNGLDNDTIVMVYEYTDRKLLDQDAIIRINIKEIENRVKAVGVDYGREYNDNTWTVTTWNKFAMHTLLGQMYLHIGDYTQAMKNFNQLLQFSQAGTNVVRFGLDNRFSNQNWKNILSVIDENEHIFTLWFGKTAETFQRNPLQYYFSSSAPNIHAIKPTSKAVELWETIWTNSQYALSSSQPQNSRVVDPGIPGDFHRGNGVSFAYVRNGRVLSDSTWAQMMNLKMLDRQNELMELMEGVDTVVYKYSIGKNPFSHDADFMLYRAAAVHLYAAEIYANWRFIQGGQIRHFLNRAEQYIYNGQYQQNPRQLGVAGRVGLNDRRGISVDDDIVYDFHPYTNQITGFNVIQTTLDKQMYLEDILLDQKARELAFEGERYYDLLRIARRRNEMGLDGTGFLADKISGIFSGSERQAVRSRLMDESNWYLPFILN